MRALRLPLRLLYALWYFVAFLSLTLVCGVLCLIASLFSKRAARVFTGEIWAGAVLGPALISVSVSGRENLPPGGGGFVVFLNHRSLLDIPAAALATGLPLTWLAKYQLGSIPLFGWCLKRAHMLIVREGGSGAAKAMVEEASERLVGGEVIAIFPEGTRNRGAEKLLPFKKGAFVLAKHTGAPLLPIATWNTGNLWPAGAFLPKPGSIKCAIGPPLQFGPKDSLNTIAGKSHDALLELYATLEKSASAPPEGKEAPEGPDAQASGGAQEEGPGARGEAGAGESLAEGEPAPGAAGDGAGAGLGGGESGEA
jgi:1-acyl-sn-glycerol-3-phosphate acyltransferase